MPACAFFGKFKDDESVDFIDFYDMYEKVYYFFEFLIIKTDVKIFYTTADSDFDSMCEAAIGSLKEKYKDIELVKIAEKGDNTQRRDPAFDRIINLSRGGYIKRCVYAALRSEYILIDNVITNGLRGEIFMYFVLSKCLSEKNIHLFRLDKHRNIKMIIL